MKNQISYTIKSLFLILFVALYSCEDLSEENNSTLPTIELYSSSSLNLPDDINELAGEGISFRLEANSGEVDLDYIRILEDGVLLQNPEIRLNINGTPQISSEIELQGTERKTFQWQMDLVIHSEVTSKNYTLEIVDEAGNEASASFTVNTQQDYPQDISLQVINVNGSGCFVTGQEGVAPSSWICFNLEALRSSSEALATLTIKENGNAIYDTDRLKYRGSLFSSNPMILPEFDRNGFVSNISIKSPDDEGAISLFSFEVKGEDGSLQSTEITITTAIYENEVVLMDGILLNQAGPTETGGLDLETGQSVGSLNPDADIRDMGIDLSLPLSSNWIQRIAPANSALLVIPPSQSEYPFTFSSILYPSEIEDIYNLGTTISASQTINIGDVFLVNNGVHIYMIQCTDIYVSSNDNSDYYQFDIKY